MIKRIFTLIVLLATGSKALSPTGSKTIKIGVSLGITDDTKVYIDVLNGLYFRAAQLNQDSSLISGDTKIELVWQNNLLEQKVAIYQTNDFITGQNKVAAIIGGGYSRISKVESFLSQYYNIPMCCKF